MIYATSEYGQMIDFLRANTFVTREEYMWQWTIPQIRIASADFTHVRYLSEKQKKMNFGSNNLNLVYSYMF